MPQFSLHELCGSAQAMQADSRCPVVLLALPQIGVCQSKDISSHPQLWFACLLWFAYAYANHSCKQLRSCLLIGRAQFEDMKAAMRTVNIGSVISQYLLDCMQEPLKPLKVAEIGQDAHVPGEVMLWILACTDSSQQHL